MSDSKGSVADSHSERKIVLYGLSTCIWCRRTRRFLEEQGVAFDFVYVDLLEEQERAEAVEQVRRWNPAVSFPTIVVDDRQCVMGYKPDKLKEVLGL